MRYGGELSLKYACSAYSAEDLRWRVVWFRLFGGYSEEETCFYLGISKLTLWRYLQSYILSGNVDSQRIGRPLNSVQFEPRDEIVIMEAELEKPLALIGLLGNEEFRKMHWSNIV